MIGTEFDSRTLILMNAALDRVCAELAGGQNHKTRKCVAKEILRCVKNSDATLDDLIAAGRRGLNGPLPGCKVPFRDQLSQPANVAH